MLSKSPVLAPRHSQELPKKSAGMLHCLLALDWTSADDSPLTPLLRLLGLLARSPANKSRIRVGGCEQRPAQEPDCLGLAVGAREMYDFPKDTKQIRARIQRYERELHKEHERFSSYADSAGKRYLLGP